MVRTHTGLKPEGENHAYLEIMRTHHALINVFSRMVEMSLSRLTLLRVLALSFQRNREFGKLPVVYTSTVLP